MCFVSVCGLFDSELCTTFSGGARRAEPENRWKYGLRQCVHVLSTASVFTTDAGRCHCNIDTPTNRNRRPLIFNPDSSL